MNYSLIIGKFKKKIKKHFFIKLFKNIGGSQDLNYTLKLILVPSFKLMALKI